MDTDTTALVKALVHLSNATATATITRSNRIVLISFEKGDNNFSAGNPPLVGILMGESPFTTL